MNKPVRIIGISAFYHDAAAALIIDGKLIAAAQEERFSRQKNDADFPEQALKFCLEQAGLGIGDIDYLVFYEKPLLKFERIILTCLRYFPKTFWFFVKSMMTWFSDKLWIKGKISELSGIAPEKILFSQHHLSHAASSYFCSPFDEAAILTIDGVGEWATTTIGSAKANKIEISEEIHFPNSIGLLYSTLTAFLGFEVNEGEYKVMGMASFGKPKYVDEIKQIFKLNDDGSFTNVERFFAYLYDPAKSYTQELLRLLGPARPRGDDFFMDVGKLAQDQHYADIARSLQVITEEAVLALARKAQEVSGSKNLCFSGGVALNCTANERIVKELGFEKIFIQPAAGDAGSAIGAAYYAYNLYLLNEKVDSGFYSPYWGSEVCDEEIEAEIKTRNIAPEKISKFNNFNDTCKATAKLLSESKVIGWCQGRFEWGPRALGARSILGDPRRKEMQDIINVKIKFREPFRPFAPACLKEYAHEYFDTRDSGELLYHYMLATAKVLKPDIIPAVTHVDGSGRVQSVDKDIHPKFYKLIREFNSLTSVPIIINTSFNLRGEPIVRTAANAMNTFYKSGIDVLVINNYLISK
jgi:carbamoyltransferase